MSTKRTRRSPSELLAAQQAKLQSLAIRAAKEQANSNPQISRIVAAISDLSGMITAQQRNFAKGPQSFAARRQSHKLWLDEIDRAEELARVKIEWFQGQKQILQEQLNSLAAKAAAGEVLSPAAVDALISEAFEVSQAIADHTESYIKAKNARQAFKEQFGSKKDATDADGDEFSL
jgi:hypothetical protein